MNSRIAILLSFTYLLAVSCNKDTAKTGLKNQDNAKITTDSITDKIAEVTVMELKPSVFHHEIVSNGKLSAREKVDLNFQTPGLILNVYVRNGQRVSKGQKIASLDPYKLTNQLAKDRNAVASAKLELQDVLIGQGYDPDALDKVPDEVMRLARLRSGLEQAEISLAATERELKETVLTAPVSGIIANLSANPHNMSSSATPLCSIINDAAMGVAFSVLETELPMVKPGDAVSVTPFSGGDSKKGRITEINPMVDDNGMVKVWAAVDGGGGLIDGMNVRVTIRRDLGNALVIPKSALVLRSGREVVFTLSDDKTKAQWNYVTTGLENLGEYTITDGLEPDVTVITSGNINLAHESPVKVISD
ncbi:MAG: efflux RND transporter periplasmic adaptor subunit [Muribaculaceae bacterium]|nr:efflux RND transporter periplasmic adaptor subunit [Muribaculaceae bacterium]